MGYTPHGLKLFQALVHLGMTRSSHPRSPSRPRWVCRPVFFTGGEENQPKQNSGSRLTSSFDQPSWSFDLIWKHSPEREALVAPRQLAADEYDLMGHTPHSNEYDTAVFLPI